MCNDCSVCRAWLEENVRQAMFGKPPDRDNIPVVGNVNIREEQARQAMFGFSRNEKGEEVQLEELTAQGVVTQPDRCPKCHCLLT